MMLTPTAKAVLDQLEVNDRDVALLKAIRELDEGLISIDVHRGAITGITGGIIKRNFDNEEDLDRCLNESTIKIYR